MVLDSAALNSDRGAVSKENMPLTASGVRCRDAKILGAVILKLWRSWHRRMWTGFICELLGLFLNALFAFGSPRMWLDAPKPLAAHLGVSISGLYLVTVVLRLETRASFEILFDKTSKYRIYQQIHGCPAYIYWLAWGLYYFALSAGYSLILVIFSHVVPYLFRHTSPILLWVVLTLAHMHVIVLGFFCGNVIQNAERLGMVNLLFMLVTGGALAFNMVCHNWLAYWVVQLLPMFSIVTTFAAAQWLEVDGKGLTSASLLDSCCSPGRPEFGGVFFSGGAGILSMAGSTLLYALLTFWLDQVCEGMWGVPRRWNFFCPSGRHWQKSSSADDSVYGSNATSGIRPQALRVHELVKVYAEGNGRPALDHVNLEIQAGEVFALLGHNGSGKSTLIHCVVGMIAVTSGSIHINGCSVTDDPEASQRQLALCPQESPVFPEFTVQDHLEFYSVLRGAVSADMEGQVAHVLRLLDLVGKRKQLGAELSGGQRRRLWVATALLGSAPVVLLDEPSSGMDPASRHKLWGALAWIRSTGRTVIFTTHYLEEADVMAERKAILCEGREKAVGTSMELKRRYAVGYNLTLELAPDAPTIGAVRELVLRHVPRATERVPSSAADTARLAFALPFGDTDLLGPLLGELEQRAEELAIREQGLQMSSLEDVFLRLVPGGVGLPEPAGADAPRAADPHPESGQTRTGTGAGMTDSTSMLACVDAERGEALQRFHSTSLGMKQMAALMYVRARVLLDGGLVVVLLKYCLPVVLINSYMAKSRDNTTPGGWYTVACAFPLSFAMITGPTMRQLTEDQLFKRKFMMLVQGMRPWAYWCAGFLFDYLTLLPLTLAVPLFAGIFKMPYLTGPGLGLVLVQACLFPIHLIVFIQTVHSFMVVGDSQMEATNHLLQCVGTCLGATLPSALVWCLICLAYTDYPHKMHLHIVAHRVHWVFAATLPPYSMPGVMLYVLLKSFEATGNRPERPVPISPGAFFITEAAAPLYLAPIPTALLALRLLARARSAASSGSASTSNRDADTEADAAVGGSCGRDAGVLAEEARLQGSPGGGGSIISYHGLRYTYLPETGAPVHAVRGVSLGLRRGECFGLLGPNGAGKTTTLACLTGELWPPSAGSIFMHGKDLALEGFEGLYGNLGMCLQHDTHLWGVITGREHLTFYSRLKGVPDASLEDEVDTVMRHIGLRSQDADRPVNEYSGGMKRRLSIGIAFISRPLVLFMDEPTAAVDVMVKRQLWATIRTRGAGQTVLLTSHQMEEVEALCDRIAMQVLGQLRALGTPTQLRHRYGKGYQLELLTDPGQGEEPNSEAKSTAALLHFVSQSISSSAKLLDEQPGRTVFQLGCEDGSDCVRLATLFTEMAKAKTLFGIRDYSVRQPTLEQVFIHFAQEQASAQDAVLAGHAQKS